MKASKYTLFPVILCAPILLMCGCGRIARGLLPGGHSVTPTATSAAAGPPVILRSGSPVHFAHHVQHAAIPPVDPALLKELLPMMDNSVGVVVLEPEYRGGDPSLTTFGKGCGWWLHLAVSGVPEFGQNPSWEQVTGAEKALGWPKRQLGLADARALATKLGLTHAAVGVLTGDSKRCVLTYQLYTMPAGKPLGAPLTASGTEDQVLAALPKMAQSIAESLGAHSATIPPTMDIALTDFGQLGSMVSKDRDSLSAADRAVVDRLAPRVVFAALMQLTHSGMLYVQPLFDLAPSNPAIAAQTAGWGMYSPSMAPERDKIRALYQQYPNNYQACLAAIANSQVERKPDAEIEAAKQAIRLKPRSGWSLLAQAFSDKVRAVRHGRAMAELSASDRQTLEQFTALWVQAAGEETRLEPKSAYAWIGLSEAAMNAGLAELANMAFWRGQALSEDSKDTFKMLIYEQGVSMFQPKWFDDPAELQDVIDLVASKHPEDAISLGFSTKWDPDHKVADRLFNRVADYARIDLTKNGANAGAHNFLARALENTGQIDAAMKEYAAAVKLRPESESYRSEYGGVLVQQKQYAAAVVQYQEALRIKPDQWYLASQLAWCLKELGRLSEAEAKAKDAIRLVPGDSMPHNTLAAIYVNEHKPELAIAEYRESLRINPNQPEISEYLAGLVRRQHRAKSWWPW